MKNSKRVRCVYDEEYLGLTVFELKYLDQIRNNTEDDVFRYHNEELLEDS